MTMNLWSTSVMFYAREMMIDHVRGPTRLVKPFVEPFVEMAVGDKSLCTLKVIDLRGSMMIVKNLYYDENDMPM